MSQRLGMADGRCATILDSGRIMNDMILEKNKIEPFDNFSYRMKLQSSSPEEIIAPPACQLFSYKDYDIRSDTNVLSK